jgi:hypothetical protein
MRMSDIPRLLPITLSHLNRPKPPTEVLKRKRLEGFKALCL